MLTKTKLLGISLCAISLSACMIDGSQSSNSNYSAYNYENTPLYPEGYENTSSVDMDQARPVSTVVVPESYHVSTYQSPIPPKDLDRAWISRQNPQAYTIELANDERPAPVAGVLQKVPKNEHMAEVKYQSNGKAYYKGLYGSYPNVEAAQQALNALPEDVKQGARVQTWSSVQDNITE